MVSNKQVAQGQRAKQAPDGGEDKSQVGPKSQHSWLESRGAWLVVVEPGEDQASPSQPNHNLADLASEIFLRFVSSGFWKSSYCVQFLRNVPKLCKLQQSGSLDEMTLPSRESAQKSDLRGQYQPEQPASYT